jgi:hypothetical protein
VKTQEENAILKPRREATKGTNTATPGPQISLLQGCEK